MQICADGNRARRNFGEFRPGFAQFRSNCRLRGRAAVQFSSALRSFWSGDQPLAHVMPSAHDRSQKIHRSYALQGYGTP
jgi:hypothetical protein